MQIRILKDAAISLLKRNIEKNKSKYLKNDEWIEEYFKEQQMENFYVLSNIFVEDFELKLGDKNLDAENAVIVHKAMKNLLPIQARDEKLWAYLTHTIGYKYMKNRWEIDDKTEKNSRIVSRYFFQGKTDNKIKSSTVPYVRNGLSRLWWAGYIVYDDNSENPYEYMQELFVSQDMFVGLCERDIAKNKDVVLAILKNVRKYNIKDIPKNTKIIRDILKEINFSAGLAMYDAMSKEVIYEKINQIFEKKLKK